MKRRVALIALAACAFLLTFWAGRKVGLAQGYGSDAEHDETLEMMLDCADRLTACDADRHTLAVSCVEACAGCNDGSSDDAE
jgi:hypothetical protein